MKKIDSTILKSIKYKNKVPKELSNMIISTTNELYKSKKEEKEKKLYNKYIKVASGLCAGIILTTGIVFAKDIDNYIKTLFNLTEHGLGEKQIQSAISENYIQYDNSAYIKSNDLSYKLEHVLLNDINLIFSIDFITEFNIEEFNDLSISGLEIKDEKGNQIYIDSEDQNIWAKNIANSMRYDKIQKSKNEIKSVITLTSSNFPNINKIYINFDKIILYTIINGKLNTKEVEGNYNLEINIDSKFNDRKTTKYSFDATLNNANINMENVILTNTGLGVTFNNQNSIDNNYEFEILDTNNNKVYSKKNDINNIGDTNKYFTWLDISDEINNFEKFILKIINSKNEETSFIITKIQ